MQIGMFIVFYARVSFTNSTKERKCIYLLIIYSIFGGHTPEREKNEIYVNVFNLHRFSVRIISRQL